MIDIAAIFDRDELVTPFARRRFLRPKAYDRRLKRMRYYALQPVAVCLAAACRHRWRPRWRVAPARCPACRRRQDPTSLSRAWYGSCRVVLRLGSDGQWHCPCAPHEGE